jgi:hypothetical protein
VSSGNLAFAAYIIAANADPGRYTEIVARMSSLYRGMSKRHQSTDSFSSEYAYMAMRAISDAAESEVEIFERLYERLSTELPKKSGVITIAQILAIGGKLDHETVHRVFTLNKAFMAQNMTFGGKSTLPLLGILALLSDDVGQIVRDTKEAHKFIGAQKEFGDISVEEQLIYAVAIVASGYPDDVKEDMLIAAVGTYVIPTLHNDDFYGSSLFRFIIKIFAALVGLIIFLVLSMSY